MSILGSRQEAVARHFATRGGTRLEHCDCEYGDAGLPLIKDALVQAECRVHSRHDVGDHRVFFGQGSENALAAIMLPSERRRRCDSGGLS
ncbi:MAG: flavin reductase family protein [Aldersonia sp.]|nr:flavin reductase family protein [Aldersonia sp.]